VIKNSFVFLVAIAFLFACEEAPKPPKRQLQKKSITASKEGTPKQTTSNNAPITQTKIIPLIIPPDPCPDPAPVPGFLPDPYPIDPPGFLEPVVYIDEPPRALLMNIHDSLVKFPSVLASFGAHPDELLKYIDAKIANQMEFKYLKELGIEGKIYIRLLIDAKGKVRDVTFLKFSDKELEILKNRLNTALRAMPNWSPAKEENGQSVVSEFIFPFRIQFE
jgi:outer membrane biosynthesis protein TonB